MKKLYPYLISLPIILFSMVPSINWHIDMPGKEIWIWYALIAGLLGFYILFLKTNVFLKIVAIGGFINCFFSIAPYVSFTAYISLVFCCYFYILCSHCDNWKPVFNILKAVLLLNVLLLLMQTLGKDALLNFGLEHSEHFGTIGHHMQMGSLTTVLAAVLYPIAPWLLLFPILVSFICNSTWTFLAISVGVFVKIFSINKKAALAIFLFLISIFIMFSHSLGKFEANLAKNGRLDVWIRSVKMVNEHPIVGYGIGTFHEVFPALAQARQNDGRLKNIPYKTAHNFLIQILFETGYSGLCFTLFTIGFLFWKLRKHTAFLVVLSILFTDGLVHFPDRMIQTAIIIIAFLAYAESKIREIDYGK